MLRGTMKRKLIIIATSGGWMDGCRGEKVLLPPRTYRQSRFVEQTP